MTPAVKSLKRAGVDFELRHYDLDDHHASLGEYVAARLGLAPQQVFKTLVVSVEGRRQPVVAIVPVTETLDLKALAGHFGARRATMAERHAAERATGYRPGGISPLGQRLALAQLLDDSAAAFERIHVSGGRAGIELTLATEDLVRLTGARMVALAARD
ncbi:Cys-tRNA(Pro) deacylase [Kushneria aurantia]|uniref:Cys-tRNA(Pro)/Cys-tRNA(Cys) deacylase n=1 Tax=Kushneria aurantia TaxID=504092 RepID=A0ABV6G7G8_9GAMM|nr:Cys-tRNA(Pro) deacylase [Kushneria aurantia]